MAEITRRALLQSVPISVAGLSGCVARSDGSHPVSEPPTDWPSFRLDQRNTGYAKGAQEVSDEPSVEWTFETGDDVWGSPVVVDGTVYVGSADNYLYALDASSGEESWRFQTGHRVEGSPAVGDGTVYVGSYDQSIYALDAATGEKRWEYEANGLIRGSPTVTDQAVYIGVGCFNLACEWYATEDSESEEPADDEPPEVGWIYSLDPETGETNWRYEVGSEAVSTPAVNDGTVYVGSSDEYLYAIDAATGEEKWTYEAADWIWSSPAVAFGTVYVGDFDGNVVAVDESTGEEQWTYNTFGAYLSSSPAVDDDTVYIGVVPANYPQGGERNDAEVVAIDRRNGGERWSFETDVLEIGSSPVVTDERVYIGSHSPVESEPTGVHALTTDGDERWLFEVGERGVGSSPALVDGVLYFGGVDNRVYALE
ncbi:hypothetical protein EA462_13240 [Natrarchaeobius halalkaliphilus]|uniref:Pyrrolo-quinoline quinone repeat domain-containing protein n=1 Tax=Natrarchaeobius halalkaliphilus TaxID=1679091 RepID=A0A3N6P092_9EURY|nr:PQQ-binding-like beta-propeller repeat protein [Natrarchaeobius halalkaliphilus]RQG87828.1 hypothetical protein EA462_13240 [Natrarchaeobius halalkaliphilus]